QQECSIHRAPPLRQAVRPETRWRGTMDRTRLDGTARRGLCARRPWIVYRCPRSLPLPCTALVLPSQALFPPPGRAPLCPLVLSPAARPRVWPLPRAPRTAVAALPLLSLDRARASAALGRVRRRGRRPPGARTPWLRRQLRHHPPRRRTAPLASAPPVPRPSFR